MARQDTRRPTDAELDILRILWRRGPGTVREIYHEMNTEREAGYTTVLKIMQIMTDKGLLVRDRSVRPQVYSVAQSQGKTQRQMLGDLLERVFSGSPGNLVLQALSTKKATPEERRQIRELLDRLEKEQK
jgi:BlaI family transcriptional regulator, penicillinase repressor